MEKRHIVLVSRFLLVAAVLFTAWTWWAHSTRAEPAFAAPPAMAGEALFHGRETLTGRLRQQPDPLAAIAAACVNCHSVEGAATVRVQPLAPALGRERLLSMRKRSAGPPSAYDQASFCSFLRSGVNPSFVVTSDLMPVYDVSEEECRALWAFLIQATS